MERAIDVLADLFSRHEPRRIDYVIAPVVTSMDLWKVTNKQ